MRLLVFFISLCIICLPKSAVSQEIKSKNVNLIALDFYEDEFFKISYSDLNKLNFKEISQGSINFGFKSTRCFIRGIFQNKGSNDFSGI
ncbi:MAG: hypothetical protein ACKO8Q_02965, partial [Bacteroidota bacterium]